MYYLKLEWESTHTTLKCKTILDGSNLYKHVIDVNICLNKLPGMPDISIYRVRDLVKLVNYLVSQCFM